MLFTPLKNRLNPPNPVSVFVKDITTDVLKNQILGIVSKYYYPLRSDYIGNSRFYISAYSDRIVEAYSISVSLDPRTPDQRYTETATFDYLNEASDYEFFEFLDCMIYVMYSDFDIRFDPYFNEFISDINDSLKLNGIDYVIINGHLHYRTEEIIQTSAVNPCMLILQRHALFDADKFLLDAYQSFKQGDNNKSIVLAVKSLENVVHSILCLKDIDIDPKKFKLQDQISLLLEGTNSDFLSGKISHQYVEMEKIIFQVAMSSRNEVAHGSNRFYADDFLVEHTLNIVSSDILFLVRICLE